MKNCHNFNLAIVIVVPFVYHKFCLLHFLTIVYFALELLARLITDFAELKPQYYSLGVQLKVPVYIIEEIKSDTGDRLAKIFDHWLHNTQEDLWFEQLYTAVQQMHKSDLAAIVQEKYMKKFSKGSYVHILFTFVGDITI